MFAITRKDLDRLCPRPKSGHRADIWDGYAQALEQAGPLFNAANVTNDLDMVHAISQWAHESGGFTILWESGNYTAARILSIFGVGNHSAKVTRAEAEDIASLPTAGDARARALFERVYGLGNPKKAAELGNVEPGDGYKYRGFGPEQLTGKDAHQKYLGFDYAPVSAVRASLSEWQRDGCSALAMADDCRAVTKKINGGLNGFKERQLLLKQAKEIWLNGHSEAVAAEELDAGPDPDEVIAGSRKAGVVRKGKIAAGTVMGFMGAPAALEKLSQVTDALGPLQQVIAMMGDLGKDHFVIVTVVLAALVYFGGSKLLDYMHQDVKEGRYEAR